MAELPPGTGLSHYRIVSKIGAGSMGEVYLAQDTSLDRKVALKILPADLAANRDRMERFIREAKSAAALNHPNIATIHEIGESDGVNFIAMEFIDGATVREKIHRDRGPLSKLLKYLIQGAEGLSKAHAAWIVHAPTPQLKDVNPLAPDDLQRVVRRCLAKEPEKRYQSMKEVALEIDDLQQELKGLTGSEYSDRPASPTTVTTSGTTRADEGFWVAVLPFKARDADPEIAALADGLSEEIVTGLSRFRYLSVVASASAARLQ